MDKTLYANTTQVSNYILDNLDAFTDAELRILLLVTRKTIGWHKETDYLTYNYIMEQTGIKSGNTLSRMIQCLVKRGFIVRLNEEDQELFDMPQGYRGKVFYALNKNYIPTGAKNALVEHWCKNYTSTGALNAHNKTHSLQNSLLDTNDATLKSSDELSEFKSSLQVKEPSVRGISQEFQDQALKIIKALGISDNRKSSYFKAVQKHPRSIILTAYAFAVDHPNMEARDKMFFWKLNQCTKT